MKKAWVIVLCVMMCLSGCAVTTFETVDDPDDVQVMAVPAALLLELPEDAAVPAMEGASGKLYFCDDYHIAVETLVSGNLDATLRTLTGFDREELSPVQTKRCGVACYEAAWSAAGENGDQIGRVLVLDDGSFHYCVSVMASAADAAQCADAWTALLESVDLAEN